VAPFVARGGGIVLRWLEQALGAAVILLVLLDVFLTVLYARAGTGVISDRVERLVWRVFRMVAKPFWRGRGTLMSFCGPVALLLLIAVWDFGLTLGTALVIHPALSTSVTSGSGRTQTDFITALYAAGTSTSIVGAGDYSPRTPGFRMFYLLTSLVGTAVVSLTLTYLMQVYSALRQRNAYGLKIHLATAETGDAAEFIAGLGPEGQFESGYANLSELAAEAAQLKEAHHFYPVLFFFRFNQPFYAVSQFSLVSLDTVTLIKSALDDEQCGWLKESMAVEQFWRATLMLVTTLEETYLPGGAPRTLDTPDDQTRDRWRRRYFAALRRLRQAGIKTIADEQAGAATYLSLRAQWEGQIKKLAPSLAFDMEEIDRAGSRPESSDERRQCSG
jgi:hypothetical protein